MNATPLSEQIKIWKTQEKKINIGIKITKRDVRNQLVTMLLELNRYSHIDAVVVVPRKKFEDDEKWYRGELPGSNIVTYTKEEEHLLEILDVVLLQETNPDTHNEFPASTVKIGLPHGVDLLLTQTMYNFGGGYCFDYILGAIQKPVLPEGFFLDSFIPELLSHSRPYVCELPFGFPKLDIFLKKVSEQENAKRPGIAYHLSNLMMEAPSVPAQIYPTLQRLLENFPQYNIVFRPYHADYSNPVIARCLELGKLYENFFFSDADNYIDDYSSAVAMVCHRPYKLHLFGLATGRNTFLCHPDDSPISSTDPLFISCPESKLIEIMKDNLSDLQEVTYEQRLEYCRSAGIYNPGSSIDYFVKTLDDILENRKISEGLYYPLNTEGSPSLRTQVALHLLATRPASMTFTRLVEKYPDNLTYRLYAADSYARVTWGHGFYYQRSLNLFHSLMSTDLVSWQMKNEMSYWWKACGRKLLDFLLLDSKEKGYKIQCDVGALLDYADQISDGEGRSAGVNIGEEFPLTVIDLAKAQKADYTGPIIVYYSGILTRDFLQSGIAGNFDIVSIVDPDPGKQGMEMNGFTVQSPDTLGGSPTPILICSHSRRTETSLRLWRELGADTQIYGLCQDERAMRLLSLLDNASPAELGH